MALNDIKVPKENAQGTFDEIALAASDLKLGTTANLPLRTGSGGVIEAGSFGTSAGSFCEGNDARLSDDRDPNLHAASHAAGGTDALAPSDIGAQSIFTASDTFLAASPTTLTAGRAQRITVSTVVASTTELVLPTSSNQNGDMVQIIRSSSGANQSIVVKTSAGGSTLADLGLPADAGRSFTFRYVTGPNTWLLVPIDSHPADRITSGTLDVARLPVGTGSTEVAAGNHTHVVADVTGAAASGSITTSGLTQASARILGRTTASTGAIEEIQIGSGLSLSAGELSATSSGGISAVGASAADVFSVSGGTDLVADDGGLINSANPAIVWNDASGKLVYQNPLERPSGAGSMFIGLAPSTTALGTNAINIQAARTAASQVAGGANGVVVGNQLRCEGSASVGIGFAGTSQSNANCTGVGATHSCFAANATAIGNGATANFVNSTAIGDSASDGNGGRGSFATRPFGAVYWGGQTTNATATILNLDATATNRFTIAANTALAVDILLVARRSDTADKWLVARRFLGIRRNGSNGTALIGTVQTLGTDQSDGSPSWTFALTADDTNEALQLEVTGAASETVQWRATAFYRVV
jgi:phage gp37-like protein